MSRKSAIKRAQEIAELKQNVSNLQTKLSVLSGAYDYHREEIERLSSEIRTLATANRILTNSLNDHIDIVTFDRESQAQENLRIQTQLSALERKLNSESKINTRHMLRLIDRVAALETNPVIKLFSWPKRRVVKDA